MNEEYLDAVRLLLDVAPAIFRRPTFVLKGGTAINLFVRDMPRLSVDLDLVLADYSVRRVDALASVSTELQSIRRELVNDFGLHCELATKSKTPEVTLYVGRGRTRVKVDAERQVGRSGEDLSHDLAMDVREAEVAALEAVGEPGVVEAE